MRNPTDTGHQHAEIDHTCGAQFLTVVMNFKAKHCALHMGRYLGRSIATTSHTNVACLADPASLHRNIAATSRQAIGKQLQTDAGSIEYPAWPRKRRRASSCAKIAPSRPATAAGRAAFRITATRMKRLWARSASAPRAIC